MTIEEREKKRANLAQLAHANLCLPFPKPDGTVFSFSFSLSIWKSQTCSLSIISSIAQDSLLSLRAGFTVVKADNSILVKFWNSKILTFIFQENQNDGHLILPDQSILEEYVKRSVEQLSKLYKNLIFVKKTIHFL